jgi:hypothetical protein
MSSRLTEYFGQIIEWRDSIKAVVDQSEPDSSERISAVAVVDRVRLIGLFQEAADEAQAQGTYLVIHQKIEMVKRAFDDFRGAAVARPGLKRTSNSWAAVQINLTDALNALLPDVPQEAEQ